MKTDRTERRAWPPRPRKAPGPKPAAEGWQAATRRRDQLIRAAAIVALCLGAAGFGWQIYDKAFPPPRPAAAAAPGPAQPPPQVTAAAARAVGRWLGAAKGDEAALQAIFPGVAGYPGPLPDAAPAVSGLAVTAWRQGGAEWEVTVAAAVTPPAAAGAGAPARPVERCFEAAVAWDGQAVALPRLPGPVACPPVGKTAVGMAAPVDLNTDLGRTVQGFMAAYLGGQGDIARYTAPGTAMSPVAPPPWEGVAVTAVWAPAPPATAPGTGDRTTVKVEVSGRWPGATWPTAAQYVIAITSRDSLWEVTAINP